MVLLQTDFNRLRPITIGPDEALTNGTNNNYIKKTALLPVLSSARATINEYLLKKTPEHAKEDLYSVYLCPVMF